MVPFSPRRVEPEEEQDTSYLAASDRIVSFSIRFIIDTPNNNIANICSVVYSIKRLFVFCKENNMTINEQQGKLRYEKTNPIQWLYDKLFPLPAVCPVCMEAQERLGICDKCRAIACVSAVCMDNVRDVAVLVYVVLLVEIVGSGRYIIKEI
jgi:hypothetical protein